MNLNPLSFSQVSQMTVPELFQQRLSELGERTAVHSVQGDLFFRGWGNLAASLSHYLFDRFGSLRGDRIALWLTNDEAMTHVAAVQATFNLGAMVVSLDDRFTESEAKRIFQEAEPRVLILGPQIAERLGAQGLAALGGADWDSAEVSWNAAVFSLDNHRISGDPGLWRAEPETDVSWEGEVPACDDYALIAYTSGSTGAPKGAVWTQAAICQYAERVANATYAVPRGDRPLGPEDVLQSPIPLYTAASLIENVYPALFAGCPLVFEGRRFDAQASEQRMARYGTTVYNGGPPHFAMMCEVADPTAGVAPQLLVSGGSAITADLVRRMQARWAGAAIANWYGLNESGTGQSVNYGEDLVRFPTAIGRPLPPTEMRVVDESGVDVAEGTEGTIYMRAPGQMPEYYRNPEQTARRFDGSWLNTGDRGLVDSNGLYHVVGRNGDRINRGGFKFYPAEIEGALEENESVSEAAVVGVPHALLGQQAVAFVVLTGTNKVLDEQALRNWCRLKLAPNKVPSRVIALDAFPRTAYGKVIRRRLTELYDEQFS